MRNFFKNWRFLVKRYKEVVPHSIWRYILLHFIFMLLVVATHVLNIVVPSRVIALLEEQADILSILLPVLLMALVNITFQALNPPRFFSGMEFRMYDMSDASTYLMGISAERMEGPEGKEIVKNLSTALYRGNEDGTEGMMRDTWDFLTSLLILIIFFLMSVQLPWYWILLLVLPSMLRGIASLRYNRLKLELDKQGMERWYEMYYFDSKTKSKEAAKDLRLFRLKDLFRRKYDSLYEQEMAETRKAEFWQRAVLALGHSLNFIRDVAGILILLKAYREGSLSLAQMVLYLGMMFSISARVNEVIDFLTRAFENSNQVSLYRSFFDIPQYDEGEFNGQIPQGTPELRFEHVDFSYGDNQVFRDLNLTIQAGEHVALVGYNGAGKTTLVKLACGLLTPDQGHIYLNGVDIQTVNPRERYARVAMVFQNLDVFARSFEENISLQDPEEIDRERLQLAIAGAGATKDLSGFSKGLKTEMTTYLDPQGVQLSGGQTQRLMLARALYRSGDLLILDEPTSALDPLAEAAMYEEYQKFAKDKTAIFISHRLSSTQFCDRVLFMEEGRLVQDGTHKSLMAEEGPYREMFETQARHYRTEGVEFNE